MKSIGNKSIGLVEIEHKVFINSSKNKSGQMDLLHQCKSLQLYHNKTSLRTIAATVHMSQKRGIMGKVFGLILLP